MKSLRERIDKLSTKTAQSKFTINQTNMGEKMLSAGPVPVTNEDGQREERLFSVVKKVEYTVQDQFGNKSWPRPEIIEKEGKAYLRVHDNNFPLVKELTTNIILNAIEGFMPNSYYSQEESKTLLKNTELLLKTYRNEL